MTSITRRTIKKCLLGILVLAAPAAANVLVYEDFNYGPAGGPLLGANGGTGFSGAWQTAPVPANTNSNYVLNSGSLNFGALPVSGGRASSDAIGGIGGIARGLTQTLGATGTTNYISMLVRAEGTLNAGYSFGFFGLFLESSGTHLYMGKPGGGVFGNWGIENQGGAGQVSTGIPITVGQTTLLVLRANFLAGPDQFTLYVDPTPGGPEPLSGTVKNDVDAGTITGLQIFSAGAFSIDEIRIGESYADVTGVPEPGTGLVALVGLALVALGRLRPRD